MTAEKAQNLAGQWCGQTQPHGPHRWAPSMYQSTSTFWRECAGHLSIKVADGSTRCARQRMQQVTPAAKTSDAKEAR